MYNIGFWNCIDYQNNKNYFFKSKREDILGENSIETLRSLFSKKNPSQINDWDSKKAVTYSPTKWQYHLRY